MHTYFRKPRQIVKIICPSGESYADYGPLLEAMMHTVPFTMCSAFLPVLFSRDPGVYLHVINKIISLGIHGEYESGIIEKNT